MPNRKHYYYIKIIVTIGTIVGALLTIVLLIFGYKAKIFTSPKVLNAYLQQYGFFAPILFLLLQIVQVVLPIIPGGLTLAAGVLCFGPVMGFLYNYIGICIGSCINFLLIRKYGKPLLLSFASQKTYNKYIGWLEKGKEFERLFALAIFFPLAPDDFLCMLAGLSKMTFKKFMTIIVICKPWSILVYSLGLKTVLTYITNLNWAYCH